MFILFAFWSISTGTSDGIENYVKKDAVNEVIPFVSKIVYDNDIFAFLFVLFIRLLLLMTLLDFTKMQINFQVLYVVH